MRVIIPALASAVLAATPILAQTTDHSAHGGHAGHAMGETSAEVKAAAVIHKVDAKKGVLNVTHDPIPALKWPQMTMDLPVTKRVDLSKIKPGDKVTLTLKQGVDKQYRVTAIALAK
jgi:Cu(I)/Ag(I) efflux system protein CusF